MPMIEHASTQVGRVMCEHGAVELPGLNPSHHGNQRGYHDNETELFHSNLRSELEDGESEDCPELMVELLNHGHASDLKWCMKDYRPPRYRYVRYRVPREIQEEVLRSTRVTRVVSLLHKDTGRSQDELHAEAAFILEEMGHQFSLAILRFLGGLMRKLLKQIISSITVNSDGFTELKRLSNDIPLLLIPTHRSYLDFIIVTWILFSFDIKTPVIAAGQDFMFMRGVGSLLRRCGAYFIRRSFGKDKLYWAVFTEYTQTHIINGDAPVEFFIEGTRSRTGKSLQPKFGMLSIALEPYFDARVADIGICPITLDYEKTIEENIHVRELMGIPKPKESTTGLIKARSVLDNNYGRISVKAGEILSVHQMSRDIVDRKRRALVPRSVIPSVHPHERNFVNSLAYQILLEQQKNSTVFPCSVMAAVLLQHINSYNSWHVPVSQLRKEVLWFCEMLIKLGCVIDLNEEYDIISHSVAMLSPVVVLDGDVVKVERNPSPDLKAAFQFSHSLISMGRRRNELMHSAIHPALLAKSLSYPSSLQHLRHTYTKLYHILQCEFIFQPDALNRDFTETLEMLMRVGYVSRDPDTLLYSFTEQRSRDLLVSLVEPFLESYHHAWLFTISYLPRTPEHAQGVRDLAVRIQTYNSVLYHEPVQCSEMLNLNVIENAVMVLVRMEFLTLNNREGRSVFCSNPNRFSDYCVELSLLLTPLTSKL